MALILDTGVLFAYLDSSDAAHVRSRELIDSCDEELVIPELILPEVDYWVSRRLRAGVMVALLGDINRGAFTVAQMAPADYVRAGTVIDTYADSDIGLVDASVLATVERLRENKLATLDHRHFSLLRPDHVPSLQLLP